MLSLSWHPHLPATFNLAFWVEIGAVFVSPVPARRIGRGEDTIPPPGATAGPQFEAGL